MGWNARRITPVAGLLVEDQLPTQIGTFTATGTLTAASMWVMQTVTFHSVYDRGR